MIWDRLFATLYRRPQEVPRSATVHNLGYAGPEREAYPWVAEISDDDADLRRRPPAQASRSPFGGSGPGQRLTGVRRIGPRRCPTRSEALRAAR